MMRTRRSPVLQFTAARLLLAATLSAAVFGPVAANLAGEAKLAATVVIDPAAPTVTYNPQLFGGFLEHFHRQIYGGLYEPGSPLSDDMGFRTDVIAAIKELRTPIVRWPGGCFVSAYHWRDGVGRNRQPTFDKAWGVEDPNSFGTDEFVAWCRKVGAEPYICGNAGTGTSEEMSDWVEYCNQTTGRWARLRAENGHPEPFNVRYWSVGNENWGAHEIGAKSAEDFSVFVRETVKMMRRVDNSLVLTAAAAGDDWNRTLLRTAGGGLNMISIHGYWDGLWVTDTPADYAACMNWSNDVEASIAAAERTIEATDYKGRIGIAFDEWNLRGWHHPGVMTGFGEKELKARDRNDINATYTMSDALFSACFLNACLRHAQTVKMANIAPLINVRGPLYVHPKGIVRRTTFHTMSMYANLLAPQVGKAAVTSDPFGSAPALDAVATCNAAGKAWRIALVNRHASETLICTVKFGEKPLTGGYKATILSGDSPNAFNDIDRPNRVAPEKIELSFTEGACRLPPHSLVILEVP